MIRRFNYTHRSRLALKSVTLEVKSGTPPTLNLHCSDSGAPMSDGIHGEVRLKDTGGLREIRAELQRGDSGWDLRDHSLDGLDPASTRLKVLFVETGGGGRIRAASTEMELPPLGGGVQSGRPASILPVEYVSELDGRAWRVAFPPEVDVPTLKIWEGIPNVRDLVRRDPIFRLLVLPAALECVLMEIFGADASVELPDDDDSTLEGRWLQWSILALGDGDSPKGDQAERVEWVRRVVSAFSIDAKLLVHALVAWGDE